MDTIAMHASSDIPLEERCSLPITSTTLPLLTTMDALDSTIMIVDKDLRICYYNNSYFASYGDHWKRSGIERHQLLGTPLTINDSDSESVRPIKSVINGSKDSYKDFYSEKDTGFMGMTDVIRLDTEDFHGAAVIQNSRKQLDELSSAVAYYKNMYMQLNQNILSKADLPPRFQQITGTSAQFVKTLRMASQVAPTSSSVCILGESGTGKEVLAEAIHYSSKYSNGPFIRVNCAAIPESLMESELFGYEKGAFTGANSSGKAGKFELANNGTLFLDEIGEMPVSMQVKLLRALQEREITRIGGSKPIKLNFRLITATNRDLEKMIEEGTFREDIYYRICIIPLNLPPLRERRSDISQLANLFLSELDMPQFENRHFSQDVMEHFLRYSWPGNIRELKNCVERMAILCPEEEISTEYLPSMLTKEQQKSGPKAEIINPDNYNLKDIIEKTEYDTIKTVLAMTKGNKAKALEILGISKRNLYTKLEKFGLK